MLAALQIIVFAAAIEASGLSAATPSWFEHADLMSVIISALIVGLLWFMLRAVKKIDHNQSLLFSKLDNLSRDFYKLQGEHNAIQSGRCK
jgi:hypothetical protein